MDSRILLFLLFSLLIITPATALTPLDAETMESRVLIMNTVTFEQDGPAYSMESASARLTWFPREMALQEVVSIETEPAAARTPEAITFTWDDPGMSETIMVSGVVRTRNAAVPVRKRIPFPLESVPPDVAIYLEPGEITDENREIQALASQLAVGKDDTYEVVYTLADWTTSNVNYSLASAGQPAIQKSSQVLRSRYGKCDELTALFISMNRALGIPARFVAGYSYTTSDQFATEWGGHGWAEVWFPEYGWVPFDVTYGEYGYLDASHIALKTSPDAKETSVDYSSRGNDFRMVTEPLDITVTPVRMAEPTSDDITIRLSAPEQRVGFGSAALILAQVKNNRDHYVSTRLDLGRTANSDMLSSGSGNILLRPGEQRTVPFLVRIDDGLRSGYTYTFPFRVSSRLGPEGRIDVYVDERSPVYDMSAFSEEIESYTQPSAEQPFSVTCERGKTSYVGDEVTHACAVSGADITGSGLRVCDERRSCASAAEKFEVVTQDTKAGVFTRTYTATNSGDTVKFYVTSRSVERTVLSASMSVPATATPRQLIETTLLLSSTGALPNDVNVTVRTRGGVAEQHLDDLSVPVNLTFTLPGSVLRPGKNDITATVDYTDELGTRGSGTYTASVELIDVTFMDRVGFWITDAGIWLEGLF